MIGQPQDFLESIGVKDVDSAFFEQHSFLQQQVPNGGAGSPSPPLRVYSTLVLSQLALTSSSVARTTGLAQARLSASAAMKPPNTSDDGRVPDPSVNG